MLVPTPRLAWLAGGVAVATLGVVVAPWMLVPILAADAVVLGAALLDWFLTPDRRRITAQRFVPARLSVLKPDSVRWHFINRNASTARLRFIDDSPPIFKKPAPELTSLVVGDGERIVSYPALPLKRGRYQWGNLFVRLRSPLGLWETAWQIPAASELTVYPNLLALDHYRLLALADKMEAQDARPIRRPGGATEFESLRDYAFGDDIRKLDWKASARRGKLIVRHDRAERNQTVILMVDASRLMNAEEDGTSKLDHAVNAALLLTQVALSRGDRIGLCTFSDRVHAWLTPRGGLGQGKLIGESLCDLQGNYRESDPARALQFVSARHPKRSLVVMLTDFVDSTTAGDLVAHLGLAARRHVVLLAALKDQFLEQTTHAELTLPVDGYKRAVAYDLLRDRAEVLEAVRQRGGYVIDAAPADLSPRLLNRYLEIMLRGVL